MPSSVALLRGINVGGKNLIRMPDLTACFQDARYRDVRTYAQSGNVLPELREGVDSVALGPGVIYFSRVAAQASKTRITRLMSMPVFRQMTVRNWRTTTRLLEMLNSG